MQPPVMRRTTVRRGATTAFALLASFSLTHVASAQDTATGTTTTPSATSSLPAAPDILSIPLPPNCKLRFDMDARDEDMLGVVKSFFNGFRGQSLKEVLNSINIGRPAGATAAPGEKAPPPVHVDINKVAALRLLSDSDLSTIFRDIHHVRFVAFETPGGWRAYMNSARNRTPRLSVADYYIERYIGREGGRRIMRGDFDDVQLVMVGFPNRGFAAVIEAPGMGIVLRADGYPNFEGVGPGIMAGSLLFAPAAVPATVPLAPRDTYETTVIPTR